MHTCFPHCITKAIVGVGIAMIVNFSAVYEIRFAIDTDCQVTAFSWESELALPTSRFDDELLILLFCGYRLLFWLHFRGLLLLTGLLLTTYRECDEGKQNEESSHVILHGK